MKLIKEHIRFERNQDPKDAMKTGAYIERKLQNIEKDLINLGQYLEKTFPDKITNYATNLSVPFKTTTLFLELKNHPQYQQLYVRFHNEKYDESAKVDQDYYSFGGVMLRKQHEVLKRIDAFTMWNRDMVINMIKDKINY